ncbi:hypothetical protein [Dactylosporangium sp. CA-092794]|uniref:hypothetical protein n=1 Tax=Dactylosporangium sp. CA-092794 TaxID=3239929 RepID=UPI003D918130
MHIDTDNHPTLVYEDLLRFASPRMDLLLPHGTWDRPPPVAAPIRPPRPTPVGWLAAVFDRWCDALLRETSIQIFESIGDLLFGGHGESEVVGLGRDMTVTIESDVSIGHNDFFKITTDGGAETGLNVFAHDLADVLAHPAWTAPTGLRGLCATYKVVPRGTRLWRRPAAHRFRSG